MQYNTAIALVLAGAANAFPGMTMESLSAANEKVARQTMGVPKGPAVSSGQTNCGPIGGCPTFDYNEQHVSITGDRAYADPGPQDLRGPCPGLNAAANHGYLPRDGLAHITDTITGLGQAYAMSPDLAGFLAAYAVAIDGDLITMSWSIGGPPTSTQGNLLGKAQGISWAHNKYEGDSSATRQDAYMNGGEAYKLSTDRFKVGYTYTQNGGYTLDSFRQLNKYWVDYSVQNNAYYFAPLFSTTLVSPAAYNFVINFMSNHSAEQPDGFLSPENYKTFFGITGDYPNFVNNGGRERIPENFVRRPSTKQYNAVNVFQDLGAGWAAYPDNFRLGGNINGPNTYVGINLTDFTGGFSHVSDFADMNNARCFFAQTLQQAIPDALKPLSSDLNGAMNLINKYMVGWTDGIDCPALNPATPSSLYAKYPGSKYAPRAPGT